LLIIGTSINSEYRNILILVIFSLSLKKKKKKKKKKNLVILLLEWVEYQKIVLRLNPVVEKVINLLSIGFLNAMLLHLLDRIL